MDEAAQLRSQPGLDRGAAVIDRGATIYDKEVVLYIPSLMAATVEGGGSYQRLLKTLERLQGTQIKTNIKAGGKEEELFSWLSEARLHYFKNRV